MIDQMSSRERSLAIMVGVLVVSVASYLLFETFMRHHRTLKGQISAKQIELQAQKSLSAERGLWEERKAWLDKTMKPLENPARAGGDLENQIMEIAKPLSIVIEQPTRDTPRTVGSFQEVQFKFHTRCKWDNLVAFLYEVQSPTNFLVFRTCKISIDKSDKTQMHGEFAVSHMYPGK